MVSIRVESNIKRVVDNFARLPVKLRARAYRKALRAAGNVARASLTEAIESGTQARTGTLREARALRLSVEVRRRKKEGRISFRSDAWYGRFIARGTRQGLTGVTSGGTAGISPRVFTDNTDSGLPASVEKKILDAYFEAFLKAFEKAFSEAFGVSFS